MSANLINGAGRSLGAVMGMIVAFGLCVPPARSVPQGQQSAAPGESTDGLLQAGVDGLKAGKYKKAEDAFRKVLEHEPDNVRALLGVVQVYRAQAKYDEAIRLLQAQIQKDPARLDYHFAIGDIALQGGMYDLALREFLGVLNRVDKFSPAAGDLYFRIGQAYFRKGELDFSIIFLRQARDLQPRNALILTALGTALNQVGQKEAAEATYRWALNADANNFQALNNLAFLLAENGSDLNAALDYAERARRLFPKLQAASDTLGWVYFKKNMIDEAIGILRDVVKENPADALYRYHLAAALDKKGDHPAAIEELKAALKSNPSKEDEQKIKDLLASISK